MRPLKAVAARPQPGPTGDAPPHVIDSTHLAWGHIKRLGVFSA
jgi:hypothetical protein